MSEATDQLLERLKAHYLGPSDDLTSEILLTEVEPPGSNRRCDLLRMSGWSSRGAGIDVHELKVTRSDWLRELDDKAKAEAWWPHCNRFWVVAPEGVVEEAELPPGWGLMLPPKQDRHRRFRKVVAAEDRPMEPTLDLMQQIVNRAHRTALRSVADRHQERMQELRQEHDERLRVARSEGSLDYRDQGALAIGKALLEQLGDDEHSSFMMTSDIARSIEAGIDAAKHERRADQAKQVLRHAFVNVKRAVDQLDQEEADDGF